MHFKSHVRFTVDSRSDSRDQLFVKMKLPLELISFLAITSSVSHAYYVGTGRYDITGPAAEVNMVCSYPLVTPFSNGCQLLRGTIGV